MVRGVVNHREGLGSYEVGEVSADSDVSVSLG